MSEEVGIEVRGRVLLVTLDRPAAKNALNTGITQGLRAAIEQLESSPDLTVGVLAGAGGTFCAGMDLKEFATSGPPKGLSRLLRQGSVKPLVAAVEGGAYGGGLELALLCDLIVAGEDAKLGLTEVAVGLFAAGGGLLRLPRRMPYAVAAEMVLTAKPIDARRAAEHGLVTAVPSGTALIAALALADRIAANAPLAVVASKQLLRAAQDGSEDDFWRLQEPFAEQVFRSMDAKEGPRAFAEKRPPAWTGA